MQGCTGVVLLLCMLDHTNGVDICRYLKGLRYYRREQQHEAILA